MMIFHMSIAGFLLNAHFDVWYIFLMSIADFSIILCMAHFAYVHCRISYYCPIWCMTIVYKPTAELPIIAKFGV